MTLLKILIKKNIHFKFINIIKEDLFMKQSMFELLLCMAFLSLSSFCAENQSYICCILDVSCASMWGVMTFKHRIEEIKEEI